MNVKKILQFVIQEQTIKGKWIDIQVLKTMKFFKLHKDLLIKKYQTVNKTGKFQIIKRKLIIHDSKPIETFEITTEK